MGPEWIDGGIIAVAHLFRAKKIPDIPPNVRRAQGEFKKGMREGAVEGSAPPPAQTPPAVAESPKPAEQPPAP
jgi:Sec-independent protein translocase protein TatA